MHSFQETEFSLWKKKSVFKELGWTLKQLSVCGGMYLAPRHNVCVSRLDTRVWFDLKHLIFNSIFCHNINRNNFLTRHHTSLYFTLGIVSTHHHELRSIIKWTSISHLVISYRGILCWCLHFFLERQRTQCLVLQCLLYFISLHSVHVLWSIITSVVFVYNDIKNL